MALQTTLLSAGVKVTATTQAVAPPATPTTIPLIFIATRANKTAPDGSTALGTQESNIMRIFTSQTDLLDAYGNPVFVTSDGEPVQGDETNEYGLLTAYSVVAITGTVYVVRADLDLGELVPTSVEPAFAPPNGTFWIDSSSVVGGIFRYDGTNWTAQNFSVYTTAPTSSDGANGDWAFDYSTLNGTLKFKSGGAWYAATTTNIQTVLTAVDPLYVSSTTPVGPASGDFWYKTSSSGGGTNLSLTKYRASDGAWIVQSITYANTAPTPLNNALWIDTSNLATTGARPLYVGTGSEFITATPYVQDTAPVSPPEDGTYWFNDDFTDFALYRENGNLWYPVETTLNSNPTNLQKVISASAPLYPDVDAIWVDVSNNLNLDNFPVIKRWDGSEWITLAAASAPDDDVDVVIHSVDPIASVVEDGSYWLNTGESLTTNMVKKYNSDFVAHTVDDTNTVVVEVGNHWEPFTGMKFGRLSQRDIVVEALKKVIADNQEIRSELNYYQLIVCPGYPETYSDISDLNADNDQISLAIFDVPKFVIPNGVPVGREVTLTDWITNPQAYDTGEKGFDGTVDPYQCCAYPGGLATDPATGNSVYMPPSYILLHTIAYNDTVAYPWTPPAGPNRGLVTNVSSVGRLSDKGEYVSFNMNRGQRDICYTHAVNPIANIPHVGLVVWGQKTRAVEGSILDRINVVRLIAKMKYDFQRLMEPFLFELNNATTRRNATIAAQRYLAGLVSLDALYDYAVLCDSTNNTGDIIAEHKLIVDVAIKPEQSIEFIYVPILVLNPDDAFPY